MPTRLDSRLRGNDEAIHNGNLHPVIPTKVGIQNAKSKETVFPITFPYRRGWIPACAGMTKPFFWLKVKNQPLPSIT
ncbi:hypothetical protein GQF25_11135 [Neisseria meningitidis]|nr:hypothetical protein [Neisseria meningitidis]